MLLAHISDTHISTLENDTKNNVAKIQSLKNCVNDINSLEIKPDAVVHTGDLTHNGTLDEFKLVKCLLDKLHAPYYVTPGNKDKTCDFMDVFGKSMGLESLGKPIIYAKDTHPIRLISLDSTCSGNSLGLLNFEKMETLDKILIDGIDSPTILFLHHPPFDVSTDGRSRFEYLNETSIELFSEAIERHPQIVALFCGHIHKPLTMNFGIFDASVAPPVCGLLNYGLDRQQQKCKSTYHLHNFHKDYNYTTDIRTILN